MTALLLYTNFFILVAELVVVVMVSVAELVLAALEELQPTLVELLSAVSNFLQRVKRRDAIILLNFLQTLLFLRVTLNSRSGRE